MYLNGENLDSGIYNTTFYKNYNTYTKYNMSMCLQSRIKNKNYIQCTLRF